MANANYLSYPRLESLLATGIGRQQIERSLSSYAYVILCRETMQERMGERLDDPSIGVIGESNGEENLAAIFYYLSVNSFNESTGLNGPIKSFAEQELIAFKSWAEEKHGFILTSDVQNMMAIFGEIRRITKLWIDNISPQAPRTLWFIYAIQDPANKQLRSDLKEWSILGESNIEEKTATMNERERLLARFEGRSNKSEAAFTNRPASNSQPASLHTSINAEACNVNSPSLLARIVLIWEIIFGCIGTILSALNNPHPSKWAFIIAVGLVTIVPLVIAHLSSEGDRDKKVLDMADGFAAAGFWGSIFIVAVLR